MTRYTAADSIPLHPSDVACVDLVNSSFTDYLGGGTRRDRLGSPEWQRWFLAHHDLVPDVRGAAPIAKLRILRRDLARILAKWSGGLSLNARDVAILDAHVRAASFRPRVVRGDGGIEVTQEPLRRDWDWVICAVAASAVELIGERDPNRLKSCANPDCSWLFYDTTINRSKEYCSTTPCGSLMRVRRFRART